MRERRPRRYQSGAHAALSASPRGTVENTTSVTQISLAKSGRRAVTFSHTHVRQQEWNRLQAIEFTLVKINA